MARLRNVRGVAKVRTFFNRLPDDFRNEIVVELNVMGPQLLSRIQGRTPVRTGALKGGESWRVLPRSLKLQIGFLGTPSGRSKLFYARIVEFGRKAKTVQATRLVRGGRSAWTAGIASGQYRPSSKPHALVEHYALKVGATQPRLMVSGRMTDPAQPAGQQFAGYLQPGALPRRGGEWAG
jgi:hypothetical protein